MSLAFFVALALLAVILSRSCEEPAGEIAREPCAILAHGFAVETACAGYRARDSGRGVDAQLRERVDLAALAAEHKGGGGHAVQELGRKEDRVFLRILCVLDEVGDRGSDPLVAVVKGD